MKNLVKAGSRIIVTPEQAKTLASMKDMLEISDTMTSTIDELQVRKKEGEEEEHTVHASEESSSLSVNQAECDAVDEGMELMAEEEEKPARKKRGKKMTPGEESEALEQLMGKFVNVTDIVPPLPKKGNFKVEMIKKSQYFFS